MAAVFKEVPVVEVNIDNFSQMWPSLMLAIKSASFFAMDCELSGLGNRKRLNAQNVDDRYAAMCDIAKTRSILSVGLSCFKLQPPDPGDAKVNPGDTPENPEQAGCSADNNGKPWKNSCDFLVQSFNIMILCSEEYVVEPLSLKFLIEHGFDFNWQYSKGLPYYRGNDKDGEPKYHCVRHIFTELVLQGKPLVLHNAPVDLVFLYQNFYAELPDKMSTFLSDLALMFPGGLFDTKYIAEFKARTTASFLEYVFRKCYRDNTQLCEEGKRHCITKFLDYGPHNPHVVNLQTAFTQADYPGLGKRRSCPNFAAYGWCTKGKHCDDSHDVDHILDTEHLPTKKRKRKPRNRNNRAKNTSEINSEQNTDFTNGNSTADHEDSEINSSICESVDSATESDAPSAKLSTGSHRAGYDSFMTGFAFAHYLVQYCVKQGAECTPNVFSDFVLMEFSNKVSLSGKDIPLMITKSAFSKPSKNNATKLSSLNLNRT